MEFEEALQQHGRLLQAIVNDAWHKYPALQRVHDKDDLMQMGRLEIHQALQKFDASKGGLKSFLRHQLYGMLSDVNKALTRPHRTPFREVQSDGTEPNYYENHDDGIDVREALGRLSPDQRELLLKKFANGMSMTQLGKHFSMSRLPILKHYTSAMNALRDILGP